MHYFCIQKSAYHLYRKPSVEDKQNFDRKSGISQSFFVIRSFLTPRRNNETCPFNLELGYRFLTEELDTGIFTTTPSIRNISNSDKHLYNSYVYIGFNQFSLRLYTIQKFKVSWFNNMYLITLNMFWCFLFLNIYCFIFV